MKDTPEFQRFAETLGQAKRILLSTHQLPDGDGLGAEVALYHYLKRARKACRIYNPDTLPKRYRFLDPKSQILLGPGEVELWDTADLWIIIDTNDPRRLGKLWSDISLRSKKIVFLDHHLDNSASKDAIAYPPNAWSVSDPEAGSIAEMLYHAFAEINLTKVNKDIATGLYVSVMTDTNSFRYARTTPLSHKIAAEMIQEGVNPEEVYQNIFSSKEVSHLQLLGHMLQNVKTSQDNKVAWLEMPLALRKKHQASADDAQSFMNLLHLLKEPEVICFFREEEENQVRVSIRSKGKVIINRIAMEFGGGGHEFASGLQISGSMEKAIHAVISRLDSAVESFQRFGK